MLLLYILMIWQVQAAPKYPLNMYDTNNHHDGYCLSYYLSSVKVKCDAAGCQIFEVKQLIPYCFRPVEEKHSMLILDFQNSVDVGFTFAQLKEKNITSQMLLSWSASIDMAERYQIFLNNLSNSSSENETIFYNCTSSWFGPFCQFIFDYQVDKSFYDTVSFLFTNKLEDSEDAKVTCYVHLACKTLLSCLDWREICDGKRDCLDGSDEENCWQLEVNECTKDEYRCHNGQCIPIEFIHDNPKKPDCSDQTEEQLDTFRDPCYKNLNFECEEVTCRPGEKAFPCSDGQCINEISTCRNGRNSFLPSTFCSNATSCSIQPYDLVNYEWCSLLCSETKCVKDNCSTEYEFPHILLLFGHVRIMISNEKTSSNQTILSNYICYDIKLCPHLPPPAVHFDNLACHRFNDLKLFDINSYDNLEILVNDVKNRFRGCLITTNEIHYCNYSTMYQCENSLKCISKYRLLDGIQDCPFNDDETFNQSCSLPDIHQRFKCKEVDNDKCFTLSALQNGKEDCKYGEDENDIITAFAKAHISFQTICDGELHLLPILIDGQNHTDETECEHWSCNNTYSRCDTFWLCENGADEVNCPLSTCSGHHHACVFTNDTAKVLCLSIDQAGDGIDDCLGGTDERTKYSTHNHVDYWNTDSYHFHCRNDTKFISVDALCDKELNCPLNDDEAFCKNFAHDDMGMCWFPEESLTDVEYFFCKFGVDIYRPPVVSFRLNNILPYPLQLSSGNTSMTPSTGTKTRSTQKDLKVAIPSDITWWCNRGVPISLRMYNNSSTLSCLCPPSYYGDKCQYQNQRVSLTLRIQASSDWRTIFIFLITLIDNEGNIQSHDHIDYSPILNCRTKFNIYLLYSNRPKDSSKTYSVKIDMFNHKTMNYRASWIFPIQFPFLPVYRLAVLLKLPFSNAIFRQKECSPLCIHGQCLHYVNDQKSTFCRCEPGWSGTRCDVEYKCDCAKDSLCISNSICLCPPSRFGSQCRLYHSLCDSELCMNDGQCASIDVRYTSFSRSELSACVCPEGYVGNFCEHQQRQTRIDLSFHYKMNIPSFLLIHFIASGRQYNEKHNRTSIAKKIQFDQNALTLYISVWFNIAFVQIDTQYYLIILHEQTIGWTNISTEMNPAHRCQSVSELFNETFANQHLLKRIKYYQIPCRQQSELVCFRDDVHICLCTLDRTANCFEFDHNMTYDCEKYKYCGDDGQCFEDDLICPTSSLCACFLCHFGSRCQFSTKGSALSLDIILGYHIHSKTGISQQSAIVKIATALTTIIFVVGCINSVLSFQTFRGKQTRNVGCGLYLFTLSIISIITVIVLTLKFAFLVTSKIGSIGNRSFLHVQCTLMDFLLRFLLSTNDWLSACVAIERAVNVTQGASFNKEKSKKMAKWIIFIVIIFISCSYIYDPLHRRLISDEEEQSIWCVTQYSSSLQVFDRLLNIFHFSIPFTINSISALTIIIIAARTRSNSQKANTFKEHLRKQMHHHKHLLISPCILIILAVPRLVISFLAGCMKSSRDSSLYLIGYFISFIPSIMTFIVFVLPSAVYKKEFIDWINRIRQ